MKQIIFATIKEKTILFTILFIKPLMLKVHSYETFATQDGPGIRLVIFLQWCNFRCQYCQNPDTISWEGGTYYSKEDIFSIIEKEKAYFWDKWGVTFSWGNPLLQAKGLKEVLKYLKEKGIHTCIDTNGFYLTDDVKECIDYADFFLPDLKQIDSQKHKNLTGITNEMPLEFIKYIDKEGKNYWIRYVIVPGYTDDEKDLEKVWLFLKSLSHFQQIDLLPYHNLGKFKREKLWREYPLWEKKACTTQEAERVKTILSKYVKNILIR